MQPLERRNFMEILSVVIFSIVVILVCVVVIKASFVEVEAESSAITLFFLRKSMENPESLIKNLYSSYYGKMVIVNVDGTERSCAICRALCENNSHLRYCELSQLDETVKQTYLDMS
jgi:hypothetical protein